ncbi:TetR-like C-terminal domain-containing protein [Pseudomonas sp. 10B1]|nr:MULTISPECIES: TetR-like C-terminal domain-containing protein [unclassified Pseudomonas]MDY7562572.1 TetR-like C-terminal domain-containing protein [Pseudomonas sp. AB6]MEA9979642.1 TetR-like C-terminal domain-containing protein [Pseudomonas sp. RTS4]MEA9997305.1 TetR-like C-terminal domain-containing protein [Pseudomonas sp. AA4]MEB0086516.1 TetR-like C-terminal domain-containing protein [Pseudomonas sp. RTI1]MEB0128501.1 TetR-like C-terminal domain-containing protein [Pseudomonas sp. CCC1.
MDATEAANGFDVLQEAIKQGEVRADIDVEVAIDSFYAPIYYRLQLQSGPISDDFVDKAFYQATDGHRPRLVIDRKNISSLAANTPGMERPTARNCPATTLNV